MKVLIVDGSIQIADRLHDLLSGCTVITSIYKSVTYTEAITIFRAKKPDIVLLDICLPGKDSVELLREMQETLPGTAFIFLSAHEADVIEYGYQWKIPGHSFIDKYHEFEKIPGMIDTFSAASDPSYSK